MRQVLHERFLARQSCLSQSAGVFGSITNLNEAEYSAKLHSIRVSECPADFQVAWSGYMKAWDDYENPVTRVAGLAGILSAHPLAVIEGLQAFNPSETVKGFNQVKLVAEKHGIKPDFAQ